MSRADESLGQRSIQRTKLRDYLLTFRIGSVIPIERIYEDMEKLGLQHSWRQRLHELREEGLIMDYSRKLKAFPYGGFVPSGQLLLENVLTN